MNLPAMFDIVEKRKSLGLNQQEFWSKIGVTQSGGSRYEDKRSIPKPTQMLLHIAYGEKPDALIEELRTMPEKKGRANGKSAQPE